MQKLKDVLYNIITFPYNLLRGIFWANVALVKTMWGNKGKSLVVLIVVAVMYALVMNR